MGLEPVADDGIAVAGKVYGPLDAGGGQPGPGFEIPPKDVFLGLVDDGNG